ncbi:MAG: hypothetical protein AAGJ31_04095, partial [Verrucomicrobiota bacterium]
MHAKLPKPILQRLRAVEGRLRRMEMVRGSFIVLTTAIAVLLSLMAIDASILLFSPVARWTLSLAGLIVIAGAGWWWLVRPAFRRMTLTEVARMVESRHPEMEETVSSALQFLSREDPQGLLGSQELIEEVVRTAERDVRQVSPRKEVDGREVRPWLMAAGVFAGVFLSLALLWPKPTWLLAMRAVAPFLELGNAYAETLSVAPGDVKVPVGGQLRIEVSLTHPRLKRATVRRKNLTTGEEGVERMVLESVDDANRRTFALTIPNLREDFLYRIHAGQALSEYYTVEVSEPPSIEGWRLRYEYPSYTGIAPREEESETGDLVAVAQTKVTFTARLEEAVETATLEVVGEEGSLEAETLSEDSATWTLVMKPGWDQSYTVALRDEDGFSNEPLFRGTIRSLPDDVPTISLIEPEVRDFTLRPTEFLPLRYEAEEDYGFSRAEIVVRGLRGKTEVLEIPLPNRESGGAWMGRAGLSLAKLSPPDGARLTVQIRLADSLPVELGGAQEALSEEVRIRINRQAAPLLEQAIGHQEQEIKVEMRQAAQELKEASQKAEQARKEFDRDETSRALDELDESREKLRSAEERLEGLAAAMNGTVFDQAAKEITKVAEGPVTEARERTETAPLMDDAKERSVTLAEVEGEVEAALNQMDSILAELSQSEERV